MEHNKTTCICVKYTWAGYVASAFIESDVPVFIPRTLQGPRTMSFAQMEDF